MIGFFIIGLILIPVVTLVSASVIEARGSLRLPGLFVTSVIMQIIGFVASFAVLGLALRFIVPQ